MGFEIAGLDIHIPERTPNPDLISVTMVPPGLAKRASGNPVRPYTGPVIEALVGRVAGRHVYEAGAGNGLITLCACALGASSVLSVDPSIDEFDVAETNFKANPDFHPRIVHLMKPWQDVVVPSQCDVFVTTMGQKHLECAFVDEIAPRSGYYVATTSPYLRINDVDGGPATGPTWDAYVTDTLAGNGWTLERRDAVYRLAGSSDGPSGYDLVVWSK